MMEGETGEVSITDMNPDVFRALLHFIYSDDLPEELQVPPFTLQSMESCFPTHFPFVCISAKLVAAHEYISQLNRV